MNAFKKYLNDSGQTVAEFASKAEISIEAIYKYASGERRPRISHFNKMVAASDGVLDWGIFYPINQGNSQHATSLSNINKKLTAAVNGGLPPQCQG